MVSFYNLRVIIQEQSVISLYYVLGKLMGVQ
jgi:hypothetical protein